MRMREINVFLDLSKFLSIYPYRFQDHKKLIALLTSNLEESFIGLSLSNLALDLWMPTTERR